VNFQDNNIRRKSRQIKVGNVLVGGDAEITVQSMTNTLTTDIKGTLAQIKQLEDAGADIVRVSVPDQDSADAFAKIKKSTNIPLVADIHFDYMMALEAIKGKADCIRINPGNIGKEEKIKQVVSAATDKIRRT
jgi:(E)-4-hydroxy-3-methylbut-2-enyl-diphosphate synthase